MSHPIGDKPYKVGSDVGIIIRDLITRKIHAADIVNIL